MVFVTAICCFQSDFKRIIAYSSVSHIMAIPLLFLWGSSLSIKRFLIVMIFHGFCSPGLFLLVGMTRNWIKTRQLLLMGGLITTSPLIVILLLLFFFFTLSAPPFPSFIAEVFFFGELIKRGGRLLFIIFFFSLLSLVYNLNWFSSIRFFKSKLTYISRYLAYAGIFPLMILLVSSFYFLSLFNIF